MSHSPTTDSIEKVKMTGHASAHVVRSRSASDVRVASTAIAMEPARSITYPVAAPSIAARVSRGPNEGQRAHLHDRARLAGILRPSELRPPVRPPPLHMRRRTASHPPSTRLTLGVRRRRLYSSAALRVA